jgi:hypothetical protein
LPEKEGPFMNQIEDIHSTKRFDMAVLLVDKESETHADHHRSPTLDEIQRRAFQIHHEHGSISGGYTLDDWLEAEHELEDTDRSGEEQIH